MHEVVYNKLHDTLENQGEDTWVHS